ncbi:hypothetical protein [Rubinisphaera margarita]|uniref:hypothetical protein n=1 Tax=Rubinisphaera margarita TaxID=2909586 RepID=UPI001EE94A7D|nr:hypothetical protein [Rubinisphaera margarita]MCG6158061.1 hypothetical protein [Rubinisphaera margarita]
MKAQPPIAEHQTAAWVMTPAPNVLRPTLPVEHPTSIDYAGSAALMCRLRPKLLMYFL